MKLSDEFSTTLHSYYSQVENAEKKTKQFQSSGATLGSALKNMSAQSGGAATGFSTIATRLTGLISTVYIAKKAFDFLFESIKTGAKQQVQLSTFQSLMGNKQVGTDLYNFVSEYAKSSALDRENLSSATTSFLAYTKDINKIQQLLNLTQRLYLFNPEQGAEGAVFALKEVLSGQTMSLRNRFNMNGISADKIEQFAQKGDIAGTISYLDQVFNQFGATQGVVEANFKSLSSQVNIFKTNLMSAIGDESKGAVQGLSQTFQNLTADMAAGKFQPFFNAMSVGANTLASAFAWVAQNADVIAPVLVGVVTALAGYTLAMNAASLASAIFGATASSVVGGALAVVATVGAIAAGVATLNATMSATADKSNSTATSIAESASKYQKDQKSAGLSPIVPTRITNDPVKVKGTVEIEKENLKYVFEASAAKFFAQFNATQVNPSVNINEQHVHQEADVDQINYALGNIVAENASTKAGGNYI